MKVSSLTGKHALGRQMLSICHYSGEITFFEHQLSYPNYLHTQYLHLRKLRNLEQLG